MRNVLIGGVTYICDVTHTDNIQYWTTANAKLVAEHLMKNGAKVISIDDTGCPQRLCVDKGVYYFLGNEYTLKEIESDLVDWCVDSRNGQFTYYYDKVVFNTKNGIYAAYRDNISNWWKI